jgi:Mn-dependent DtxR family transcriptional regulator
MHDSMYGQAFLLSHEALAEMLGIHRPTVSTIAARLQQTGIIRYRHGRVTVLSHQRLEAEACECYAIVRALLDPLRQ